MNGGFEAVEELIKDQVKVLDYKIKGAFGPNSEINLELYAQRRWAKDLMQKIEDVKSGKILVSEVL